MIKERSSNVYLVLALRWHFIEAEVGQVKRQDVEFLRKEWDELVELGRRRCATEAEPIQWVWGLSEDFTVSPTVFDSTVRIS
jgi:hypothetical protein